MTYYSALGFVAPTLAQAKLNIAAASAATVPANVIESQSAYIQQCRDIGIPDMFLADCKRMIKIDGMKPDQVVKVLLKSSELSPEDPAAAIPQVVKEEKTKKWMLIGGVGAAAVLALLLLRRKSS